MKNKAILIAILSAAVFAVGCKKEETAAQQIENIKAETKNVAQDMKDYTYAQKSEFVVAMQSQLAALDKDLDTLSAKIEKSSDAVKAEAKPKLAALRAKAGDLNVQLDKVKDATESTWDSVKAGSKKTWESLKEGFQDARQWVSDKIAP